MSIFQNPLVSIVVVCFNESEIRIKRTLDSIISQTYFKKEIILIDGGSKVETINILNQYADIFSFYSSAPDNGIFDAMNRGLKNCKGEWISFMNIGDSFFESTSLERMIENTGPNDEIVYGNIMHSKLGFRKSPMSISKWVLFSSGICHQAMIARASTFSKVGLFDTKNKIGGDPDWIIRAFLKGVKFKNLDMIVCFYEGGGLSANPALQLHKKNRLRRLYFSFGERILFFIYLFLLKTWNRLNSLNFSFPFYLKKNRC